MTAQLIRRFQMDGKTSSDNLGQKQETWRLAILAMMREEGFVPLLDLDPVFRWIWVKEDEYGFTYTWQGVHVGKEKAWQTEGILGGKMIPSTPRIK